MRHVSVLIPFRTDDDWRQRVWDWCRPRWAHTGFEIIVDDGDGPQFSLAQAVNRCAARATGDVFATMGADFIPAYEPIEEAASRLDRAGWVRPYSRCDYLTRGATETILQTDKVYDPAVAQSHPGAAGLLVVPRFVWEDVGGYDERFVGWGPEDHAFLNAVQTLHGPPVELDHRALHLWHPQAQRVEANFDLWTDEYVPAIGDPERMRAVLDRRVEVTR